MICFHYKFIEVDGCSSILNIFLLSQVYREIALWNNLFCIITHFLRRVNFYLMFFNFGYYNTLLSLSKPSNFLLYVRYDHLQFYHHFPRQHVIYSLGGVLEPISHHVNISIIFFDAISAETQIKKFWNPVRSVLCSNPHILHL